MDVEFVPYDPLYFEKELISRYEALTERKLYPADPERLIINLLTYALSIIHFNINETGRQNLLAYARGNKLDALGEFYGVKRLPARPAIVTLRFSLPEPLSFDVAIPKGTRVAPSESGDIWFETVEEAKIPAGATSVEVQAECNVSGSAGNGFAIGQINQILDPLPYNISAENTTMSMYGADTEDDERFRERIRLSMERFSTAGPKGAYVFWIKSVHQDIIDAEVWSPEPGVVKATILMKDGELPSEDILSLVKEVVSDEKRRPLTDLFEVQTPEVVPFEVRLTYYLERSAEGLATQISQEVHTAVNEYLKWQKTKLGRDITPSVLINYVQSIKGVKRVEVESPVYQPLEPWQVARESSVTINYGGIEDA